MNFDGIKSYEIPPPDTKADITGININECTFVPYYIVNNKFQIIDPEMLFLPKSTNIFKIIKSKIFCEYFRLNSDAYITHKNFGELQGYKIEYENSICKKADDDPNFSVRSKGGIIIKKPSCYILTVFNKLIGMYDEEKDEITIFHEPE